MELSIPTEIRRRMRRALLQSGRREVGGILMGRQISPGRFEIADFSLDDLSGERAHFVRDIEHHVEALSRFFDRTGHDYGSYNYLGEWHSHPSFSVNPSAMDILSMRNLVDHEGSIDFAVLLIVKLSRFLRFTASATLHSRGARVEMVSLLIA
ncbi:Mov34/MPN/PAD-1 family protein [Sinorhizobium meliloti]|uniref:Mov34/MPN/PAD-1 family protein n=1 Tax=Rhizobium meliloti TaxID=382 RepID=UPI000481BC62|nr:Mov34/MPN/PAD-1 family protein [Sinorhizobium meliloti]MDW9419015.1 hypothetical protein [Sinorhizobium meliloti]MDW9515521.1 hypothetical protein [Sinorhizobium meliloti]MDX0061184.1 hypothetical protein [Sinorhizobium meliloti]MDX0378508.1 hypothetical protein [Sinorhizobium meliloti]UFX12818.1 Mov34/MPN/PAD-1 family protein [Sinorhizobium meliloti]